MQNNLQMTQLKKISQFELSKLIMTNRFFKRIELKNSSKMVLMNLTNYWNSDDRLIYPNQSTIAEDLDISLRAVEKAIKELKDNGLILIVKNKNKNAYRLTDKFFKLALRIDEHSKKSNTPTTIKQQTNNEQKTGKPEPFTAIPEQNSDIIYITNNSQINNKSTGKNIFSKQIRNTAEIQHYHSVESTQKLLNEMRSVKTGSPLDLSYDDAMIFLNKLMPELRNSFFARELRKKWGIPEQS